VRLARRPRRRGLPSSLKNFDWCIEVFRPAFGSTFTRDMLTLRPIKLGPPVYAHLADYEVLEDGQPDRPHQGGA
jgi:hypothetical protein